MFDFSIVTNWIHELLALRHAGGMGCLYRVRSQSACASLRLYAILAIVLIYMERKVCGFFQCRLGPNRVGKWGSIQVTMRRTQDADQGDLHSEGCRPLPLQPGSIHGNHRLLPHFRLSSF